MDESKRPELKDLINQLPSGTIPEESKSMATISPWKDGEVVKIRVSTNNLESEVNIPNNATDIEMGKDSILFTYNGNRYYIFEQQM